MPSNELSPSEDVRPALNATSPRLLIEAQVKLNGLKLSRALSATLVNVCGAACAVAASSMNSPSAKMASAPRTKCSAASACPRTRRLCVMTPPFLARLSPAARTEQRGPSSVSPLNRLAGSTVCFFERFPNDSCSGSTEASVGAARVRGRPPCESRLGGRRRRARHGRGVWLGFQPVAPGTAGDRPRTVGRGIELTLAVVENDEQAPITQVSDDSVSDGNVGPLVHVQRV